MHHWAKVHNIKQISQTLIYLRDHDIRDMDELAKRAGESSAKFTELSQMIKDAEKRLAELLQKKKDAYAEYRSIKEENKELQMAKHNLERFLNQQDEEQKAKEKQHNKNGQSL